MSVRYSIILRIRYTTVRIDNIPDGLTKAEADEIADALYNLIGMKRPTFVPPMLPVQPTAVLPAPLPPTPAPPAPSIPAHGFLRASQILGNKSKNIPPIIPVSAATWWRGVKEKKYPQPVRVGENIVVWKVDDIRALIESIARGDTPAPLKLRRKNAPGPKSKK